MTQNLAFTVAIVVFVSGLLTLTAYFYTRLRRAPETGWEDLIAKLSWTDRGNIAQVALDLVDESGRPRDSDDAANLEPAQIWTLIGGLEGLEILERNSDVLIELAFYVQKWYPEALVIAERLRLDARELKWHVARLKGAAQQGNLQVSFPFYAQRAVVAYYLMTQRLLCLYRAGNLPLLAELQRAI